MLAASALSVAGAGPQAWVAEGGAPGLGSALRCMFGIQPMSVPDLASKDLIIYGVSIPSPKNHRQTECLATRFATGGAFKGLASKPFGISHAAKALAKRSGVTAVLRIDAIISSERKPA